MEDEKPGGSPEIEKLLEVLERSVDPASVGILTAPVIDKLREYFDDILERLDTKIAALRAEHDEMIGFLEQGKSPSNKIQTSMEISGVSRAKLKHLARAHGMSPDQMLDSLIRIHMRQEGAELPSEVVAAVSHLLTIRTCLVQICRQV